MATRTPEEIAIDRIKIAKAQHSKNIDLSWLGLTNLPIQLNRLVQLQILDVHGNNLESLPPGIVQLKNIQLLDLSLNKFHSFPPEITKLSQLKTLVFHGNNLTHLPEKISGLVNLETLDLSDNKLNKLPSQIRRLKRLKKLDLTGNQFFILSEILHKQSDPEGIISAYFNIRRPLLEVKMILVGQGSVGKTSLINRILKNNFDPMENITEGIVISHQNVQLGDEKIKVNIWDFGGQEIMHATHLFFLTKRSLYLLVLDTRLNEDENRVHYWLKMIQSFSDNAPVIVIGNKTDQQKFDIDKRSLLKKYPNIVGFYSTSCAKGHGIDRLKRAIGEEILQLPQIYEQMQEQWFDVKEQLENLRQDYIEYSKYVSLCNKHGITDQKDQSRLIYTLHNLGVVIYFQDDPRLKELGILNPQWVTNGVYKILNSDLLIQNKGVLPTPMLQEILNMPAYLNKSIFIVDMMRKFELCYDIEPDKTFLVPDLLPKDEPAELKFNGIPAFEYAYPVLPSSVITRLIVRMNQMIDDGLVWRTGVLLKIGKNKALVKADLEDRKVTIAIDGLEHTRRDALSAIRYELGIIHDSIKGLNPDQRVPIPDAPNAEPLSYDYLLQLERDGFDELPVKAGNQLVKINVKQLLSGVETEAQRKHSAGSVTNYYFTGDVNAGGDFIGRDKSVSAGDRGIVVDGNASGNLVSGDENEI